MLIDITSLTLKEAGDLVGTGTVTDVTTGLSETFSTVVDLLTSGSGSCDILFLQIGPIDLNLLGLQLDVSQITIDLDAEAGPGNLLCAVAGLQTPTARRRV